MVENINFFLINLVLDFAIIEMVNLFLKLYVSKFELILITIFSTFPSLFYIFYEIDYFFFICLKILDYIILTLLLTDNYSIKKILNLFFILLFSMFSVFGFGEFFVLFVKNILMDIFSINIDKFYDFLIIFALFIYISSLVAVFGDLTKKRELENFLFKVSFLLFEKHIEITGFLDSGNTLYDTKTGKCVVIVSLAGIKNYLSEVEYNNFLLKEYDELGVTNELDCVVIGGEKIKIPIFDVGEVELSQPDSKETRHFKCVVGITKEKFAGSENFECLLHRELL